MRGRWIERRKKKVQKIKINQLEVFISTREAFCVKIVVFSRQDDHVFFLHELIREKYKKRGGLWMVM